MVASWEIELVDVKVGTMVVVMVVKMVDRLELLLVKKLG